MFVLGRFGIRARRRYPRAHQVSLASGTRINIYEIVGPIGAGGMGEVYRARDTRLNNAQVLAEFLEEELDRRAEPSSAVCYADRL